MGVLLCLLKVVMDEVCLIIHQRCSVAEHPDIYLSLEDKGVLVGILLGEECISRGVKEMLQP
jgi:hypothetical protein